MDNIIYNLYPEIEPYRSDWLNVSATHAIYFEECGNPNGVPVVFLHGGPGSGCNPNQRRFFDAAHYRIILLDQRGCGRSKPLGETQDNLTTDLVHDIDALRRHLNIARWLVFGGSWGSTLALAYAISHKDEVMGLILRGIFLSRPSELQWFLQDARHFFPEAWNKLQAYIPQDEQQDLLAAYASRIFSEDLMISVPAAVAWNAYENSIMTLMPAAAGNGAPVTDSIQVARARVQLHYIMHECFVGQRDLLSEAQALSSVPTIIVQGRYDMVCPPVTAWELRHALPAAEFVMVADAGHSAMEPGIRSALIAATERFKQLS